MKRNLLSLAILSVSGFVFSQEPILPRGFAPGEQEMMPAYIQAVTSQKAGFTTPPNAPLRTMAEWEEIQALVITWTGFPAIHRKIVAAAQNECQVIIHCNDSNAVKSNLQNGGVTISSNVKFIHVPYNSIWIRDYGANSVYINDVDSLILVDWIYNRPRPADDALPEAYANLLGVPYYQTLQAPGDLVHTGGNFMSDGFGNAFSSELVLEENDPGNPYGVSVKSNSQIDSIMQAFMGISRYTKMTVLPYDGIHHIDMHMKLLDEETLLVGLYPQGVADGPQIEANLQYVLSNFNSVYGTPYKVIRIPMPPSTGGLHPDQGAFYRTFTNSVFVNKTLIFPSYREEYDSIAYRIYRENLPGYTIIGIDSDDANNNGNLNQNIISQSGAIHCITHSVGVSDPLLISHQPLSDTWNNTTPISFSARIQHRSGISDAYIYWTNDTTQPFQQAPLTLSNPPYTFTGQIPVQNAGDTVYYYIGAESVSGKQQVRPITAPTGWYKFRVFSNLETEMPLKDGFQQPAFPNPSKGITCIPFHSYKNTSGTLYLVDMTGRVIETIYSGAIKEGASTYFMDTGLMASGTYMIVAETPEGKIVQKLVVR